MANFSCWWKLSFLVCVLSGLATADPQIQTREATAKDSPPLAIGVSASLGFLNLSTQDNATGAQAHVGSENLSPQLGLDFALPISSEMLIYFQSTAQWNAFSKSISSTTINNASPLFWKAKAGLLWSLSEKTLLAPFFSLHHRAFIERENTTTLLLHSYSTLGFGVTFIEQDLFELGGKWNSLVEAQLFLPKNIDGKQLSTGLGVSGWFFLEPRLFDLPLRLGPFVDWNQQNTASTQQTLFEIGIQVSVRNILGGT